MLSAKMEDYLKAIYEAQRDGEGPVSTSAVADMLDVTPPTASSMLEKLEGRGLLEREKYEGVRLTTEGETVALEVVRHHRLLETYLTEQLGYDWAAVHDEADIEELEAHGFSRRAVWDVGSVAAFFNLSNRLAHLTDMRPNEEFYDLGR